MKITIVVAEFNSKITERLLEGALSELKSREVKPIVQKVPGAFELPLAASLALKAGADGVVALGCIIRGETTHYDYVCKAAQEGCLRVSLDESKPVAFGVLTTEDFEQAFERAGGRHGNVGASAAQACLAMLSLKF
ncbi:MAG: 6,7-dimethyl-8-ribityllumazine synthase [Bdellovibrionales bacterium CG10_big_fil_rev_8_21_14_0_10_45_34]|nr:MAG: 6,7-dimethyl-8-ribityllumazine synthase [Bdellovibrionales bacterium CG10_big_fil_rev_8_21_14_0_10_45_34]